MSAAPSVCAACRGPVDPTAGGRPPASGPGQVDGAPRRAWLRRPCFAHLALLSILTAVPCFADLQQSFTGDGIKATFTIPGNAVPNFGFVPVRVTVDNTLSRDLPWQINFGLNSYSNAGTTASSSPATMVAAAGRGGERWFFVPTADAGSLANLGRYYGSYGGFSALVSGAGISDARLQFNTSGSMNSNGMVPWAVSPSLVNLVRTRIAGLTVDPSSPRYRPAMMRRGRGLPPPSAGAQPLVSGAPNVSTFDLAQPLGDWRMWSPFVRVIMRADEYAVLLPASRAALRNWVALGGSLYLYPTQTQPSALESFGAGRIVTLARPIADQTDDSGGLFANDGLFELTAVMPGSGSLSLQKGGLADKISAAKRVGDWLIYFFIGFAVIVAPINLYAIAPVRRRHWLFFTVPAISLTAVAILITAIYLQDGVGGEGARRALVVLLPGDNQAVVFQDQVSRTGLLFNTSFPLADDTVCATVPAEDSNVQPGRPLEFARKDGRALGDWFRGRARQAQHLRRVVPTRARVERVGQAANGAPIVQSSVGTTLREFYYVDRAGATWTADQVPPGQPVTLERLPGNGEFGRRVEAFAGVGSVHFGQLVRSSALNPTADRFVALAGESELAPIPTLATINWKDSAVMLAGVVAGVPAGKAAP